jgi:hypothetical protein
MKRTQIQGEPTTLRLDPSQDRRSSANKLPHVATPKRISNK